MIEKIKKVNNPLTIIAMFAGVAEVAATVALCNVDKDIQNIFVWFVMGFPVILALGFYLTLNFNSSVLYAPSDFENEEYFYRIFIEKNKLYENIQTAMELVSKYKEEITKVDLSKVVSGKQKEENEVKEQVNTKFENIYKALVEAKNSAQEIDFVSTPNCKHTDIIQKRIIEYLERNPNSNITTISNDLKMARSSLSRLLPTLEQKGMVERILLDGKINYKLK